MGPPSIFQLPQLKKRLGLKKATWRCWGYLSHVFQQKHDRRYLPQFSATSCLSSEKRLLSQGSYLTKIKVSLLPCVHMHLTHRGSGRATNTVSISLFVLHILYIWLLSVGNSWDILCKGGRGKAMCIFFITHMTQSMLEASRSMPVF